MSPIGMIFKVVKSKTDTNGKSLDLHWELLPQCNMKDPVIHIHPNAIETYHVLEGEMEFFIKDKWVRAVKGERLAVEKGVKHSFRNPTGKVVRVYNTHEPAFDMEDYFEDVCRVIDRATDNRTRPINMKSPKTILLMGLLMNNYRREVIATRPPDFLVRNAGRLAKALGMNY